jgi:hypothetical protein
MDIYCVLCCVQNFKHNLVKIVAHNGRMQEEDARKLQEGIAAINSIFSMPGQFSVV